MKWLKKRQQHQPEVKSRLVLLLPDETKTMIEALQTRMETTDISEVLSQAIAMYDGVTEAWEQAGIVYAEFPDGTRRRFVLALSQRPKETHHD